MGQWLSGVGLLGLLIGAYMRVGIFLFREGGDVSLHNSKTVDHTAIEGISRDA